MAKKADAWKEYKEAAILDMMLDAMPKVRMTLKFMIIFRSFILFIQKLGHYRDIELERTYKPHYHYQNFSPLANGTDLNREKYAILQTHWH